MSSSLRSFSIMAKQDQVHNDDEWNLKYRTYLLLAAQQDQIRQRMSLTLSSTSPMSSFSSQGGLSLSSSPVESTILPPRAYYAFNGPLSPIASDPLPTFSRSYCSEEERLLDVNRQIKATLTELLNHPDVRQDVRFTSWIKERLMDAALERRGLRKMRCERRSPVFHSSASEDELDGFIH